LPIGTTYPEHPISKIVPNVKAQPELKEKRRANYRKDVEDKTAAYEAHKKVV